MNIEVRPYGTEIQILKDSASTAALGVRCDPTAREWAWLQVVLPLVAC